MKLSVVLFFISLSQMMATEAYAQFTKLTLQLNDATVKEVLNQIEDKSDFFFLYNSKLIDVDRKVSIDATDENIDKILKSVFSLTDVNFTLVDKQIILTRKADQNDFNSPGNQQSFKTITGKVTDKSGNLMPGVTILVKGTTIGAVTDINGKYTLSGDVLNNAILVFSFVGFGTKEISIEGKSIIDLTLEEELTGLNEVVIIGYGTAKRSDLVGSTAPISLKAIKSIPSGRIDQVLQGKSTGIVVQNTTASPNGTFSIRIRGSNSLSGSNDPLVVVDGFLGGDLSSINPNDIASIEILKDASATAIYGSRGANGVIMVTTKKGKSGKTVVEYNGFVSVQQISKKIDLLNAAEYAETVNSNRTDLGVVKPFSDQQIADLKTNGGTDWQNQIYRQALQQNHQVNISGGNESLSGYLSGNYINNIGVMQGSSFNKYSVRANIISSLGKKFNTGLNLSVTKSEDHPVLVGGANGSANQDQSPSNVALIFSPTQAVYNPDGSYTQPSPYFGSPALLNPLALAIEPINNNLGTGIALTSFLEYKIAEGFTAKVLFGANSQDNENSFYYNTKPQAGKGIASAGITNNRTLVIQNTGQLNYTKTISEIHQIDLALVYEQQSENVNGSFAGSKGFSSDILTYNNLALGSAAQIPSSYNTKKVILSYLGRLNYSFKQKYLISFASRYDGASVFGINNKWGFFPSGALAWRLDKEDFIKNIEAINTLKLRTSYGLTGSQAIPPYRSLDQLSSSPVYPINGTVLSSAVGLGILGNPDLKWEKTAQFDVGLDLGMFNSRIRFTVDYYNKITKDLLLNVPIPQTSGFSSIVKNLGEVENKGFEFSLDGDPLVGEFAWNTNINFSLNKNKVLSLGGQDNVPLGTTGFPNFGNTIFLVVGQPLGVLKGYIQNGTWGTAEAAEATRYGTIPGAPKYIDQNNDGKITADDITIMATTLPKFTYGWTNNFSYKNFDFNAFIQGVMGKNNYNLSRVRSERSSSDGDATDRRILNRWTADNQNTNVPSFIGSNKYEQLQSSRWIENGAYLRIKALTLGYNLNESTLNKLGISSARIYVSGVNLFTFTKYTGYDPEGSTNGVDALGGVDYGAYPSQKSYTIGINITF